MRQLHLYYGVFLVVGVLATCNHAQGTIEELLAINHAQGTGILEEIRATLRRVLDNQIWMISQFEVGGTCGMLNTEPILSEPLNYYAFVTPVPLLDEVTLCPPGSVHVPYDIPSYQSYGPTVKGFTCTDNSWVLEQHRIGFRNCRMDLQYNKDFVGHDAANWSAISKPYHEAMRNCYANSCNGLVCNTLFDLCWLKIETPAEAGVKATHNPVRQFWTTVCE